MDWVNDLLLHRGYFISLTFFSILFFGIGKLSKRSYVKILCYNLFALVFAFLLYEAFLWIKTEPQKKQFLQRGSWFENGNYSSSDLLGYVAKGDGVFKSIKMTTDSDTVYDVLYTIKDGIRHTPNSNDHGSESAVFFGCSFTFGTGVNDTGTLPYHFNEASSRQYRTINCGLPGYGPHQMLAFTESSLFDSLSIKTGSIAIYGFIPDHIRRCAGYSSWDLKGPHYEFINNKIARVGKFGENEKLIFTSKYLTRIWQNSFTYQNNFSITKRRATHEDAIRAVEVVKQTNEILKCRGISFKILVWDEGKKSTVVEDDELRFFYNSIHRLGIPVFFVSDIVPSDVYESDKSLYSIPNDGHPTSYFYQTVATSIYNQINH
jgi:hypothetical protein